MELWLSQLGQTIQPSDVLFNLTKFSNTLSEGIDPKSVLLKEIQNYKELIQSFENIEMQTTKKEDFILLMQKDKKNYKEIDLNLTYNSMIKMQNNIAHWLNYCQKNKKNCNS